MKVYRLELINKNGKIVVGTTYYGHYENGVKWLYEKATKMGFNPKDYCLKVRYTY